MSVIFTLGVGPTCINCLFCNSMCLNPGVVVIYCSNVNNLYNYYVWMCFNLMAIPANLSLIEAQLRHT